MTHREQLKEFIDGMRSTARCLEIFDQAIDEVKKEAILLNEAQARELERVSHDLDFTNKCTIPDLESQLEQALRTAVEFAEQVAKSDQALSFDEEKWAEARAFLATPVATALQQAKEET